MTGYSFSTPAVEGMLDLPVNGPEDEGLDWDRIDWRTHEDNVRRLRQRIFKATQEGDLAKVRSLQKLILRSRSNTLVSVRQVTQRNAGRRTAGIDGEVALTSQDRADVAVRVHHTISSWVRIRSSRRLGGPAGSSGRAGHCDEPTGDHPRVGQIRRGRSSSAG